MAKASPFRIGVLTLFPELFPGPLDASIFARARAESLWSLDLFNIRDYAPARLKGRVDSPPAGGGAGMVLRADCVAPAIDAAREKIPEAPLLFLTPSGAPFTQSRARALAEGQGVLLLCSRYEGMDARVISAREVEEVSLGDFLLSGGEVAALALAEAVLRLLPGVMGSEASGDKESFEDDLLQYPHYAKPLSWEGHEIPPILLSGHHARIQAWRLEKARERTKNLRPDLYKKHRKSAKPMLKGGRPREGRAREGGKQDKQS